MKEHIEIIQREATYKKQLLFDDVNEYLEWYLENHAYNSRDSFTRVGYGKWKSKEIDSKTYYTHECDYEVFLEEKEYSKLLKLCTKKYSIHERDLVRTQQYSNARFTGDLKSEEEVVSYMRDKQKSWLFSVCDDIDNDIVKLKKQIAKLEMQKETLNDDDYLKSKIKVDYHLTYNKKEATK